MIELNVNAFIEAIIEKERLLLNEGVIFTYDAAGKKHLLNELTIKDVELQLNPYNFFKINRNEIINKVHIEKN